MTNANLPPDRLMDQIAVRVPARQRELLRLAAEAAGLTESEFVRRGLAGLFSPYDVGRALADHVVLTYRAAFRDVVDSAAALARLDGTPVGAQAPDSSPVWAATMHTHLAAMKRLEAAGALLQRALNAMGTGATFAEPTTDKPGESK